MTLILILSLVLAPFTCTASHKALESDHVKTIKSLKKVDEFPLYTMRYYGDYDLPNFESDGSLSQDIQIGKRPCNLSLWACTCFSIKTEQGSQLLGRNFDWDNHPALLLFTDPPGRFASVSMVDISYLGYSKSEVPEKNPEGLLQSPFLPFDGMNEQGLAVGMMALNTANAPNDPEKQTISSLLIIRMMLDYAKDVEEAVALFNNFNINFLGGPPLHYLITDRSGKSVVIEFVNQELSVLWNTHSWQVATNFTITGLSQESSRASCWRYNKVWETLENRVTGLSPTNALMLLKNVSQRNTIWSIVYDTSSLNFMVVMGKKFDQIYKFTLE